MGYMFKKSDTALISKTGTYDPLQVLTAHCIVNQPSANGICNNNYVCAPYTRQFNEPTDAD